MESVLKVINYEGPLQKRPLPTFIKKLWFLLSDSASQDYIFWVDNGQVICIPNAATFSQNILPRFFKHSNWQSFVRQLNLYGFRKVYQLNLAYDESAEKRTVWQFKHESFRKDAPEKLCDISRRTSRPNNQQRTSLSPSPAPPPPPSHIPSIHTDESPSETPNVPNVLSSTDARRSSATRTFPDYQSQLESLNQKILQLDRKCQELNNEASNLRTLQISQQNSINSLLQYVQHLINKDPELASEKNFQLSFQHLLQSNIQNNMEANHRDFTAQHLNIPSISRSPQQYSPAPFLPSCNTINNNDPISSSSSSAYYHPPTQQPHTKHLQGLPPISSLIGERSTRPPSTLKSPESK